jgi:hypothetical protein
VASVYESGVQLIWRLLCSRSCIWLFNRTPNGQSSCQLRFTASELIPFRPISLWFRSRAEWPHYSLRWRRIPMPFAKISRTYIKRSSRRIHDYNGVYKEGKYKDLGRIYYYMTGLLCESGRLTTNWRYMCHILSPLLENYRKRSKRFASTSEPYFKFGGTSHRHLHPSMVPTPGHSNHEETD